MGCDIHLFCEVRDGADKPWRLHGVQWSDEKHEYVGFDQRNYDVFAILANVRNGVGFAGVETGDGFNYISEPRGLPADMSAELAVIAADGPENTYEQYNALKLAHGAGWLGDHSHSHITLRELLDFNWNQRTNHSGVIKPAQYRVFTDEGKPTSYAGDIWGGSVRLVGNDDMAQFVGACMWSHGSAIESVEWTPELVRLLAPHNITPNNWRELTICTRVQWSESYKESAGDFYTGFIPALAALATGRSKDDVRIVFGFDS